MYIRPVHTLYIRPVHILYIRPVHTLNTSYFIEHDADDETDGPPLFSILRVTSQLPDANLLQISFNCLKPPHLSFSFAMSISWLKKYKLNRRIHVLHSKYLTQQLHSSYFYCLNCVTERIASLNIDLQSCVILPIQKFTYN